MEPRARGTTMRRDERRIAPIVALGVMTVVSVAIVVLTYWSGDISGPWTSVPPVVIEARGAETHHPMSRPVASDAGVRPMPVAASASSGKP
jgi:hypothetical protein